MNVLESTLQTALLPRAVFDVWQEAAKMFDQGKLAGQSVRKRSSGKKAGAHPKSSRFTFSQSISQVTYLFA